MEWKSSDELIYIKCKTEVENAIVVRFNSLADKGVVNEVKSLASVFNNYGFFFIFFFLLLLFG